MTLKEFLESVKDVSMDMEIKKAVVKDKKVCAYPILRVRIDKNTNTIIIC